MRFVAIDFETANARPDSACQLAAVVVQDGNIVDEFCWLIRPSRMFFSRRNIEIHGITPQMVANAPGMAEIWSELAQIIEGQVLIAHNARFDLGVLIASLESQDVACPPLQFNCTRGLARAAWPGRSRYGLKPLGDWLGVKFKHHDALDDARCCAHIALAVAASRSIHDLEELENALRIRRGYFREGKIVSPRQIGKRTSEAGDFARSSADRYGFPLKSAKAGVDPHVVLEAANGQRPFEGRRIVFLGALRGLSRDETHRLAECLGATCQAAISVDTHYVVACGGSLEEASVQVCESMANYASDGPTRASGIRLLSERQFLSLLPGGKASTRW